MQKNYRFRKKQKGTVLITVGGADLKAKFDSSKKHPSVWGVKAPSPLPQVMSTLELDSYGCQQKIPFSLALSELVLDGAKVKILLISWHFWRFLGCTTHSPIY